MILLNPASTARATSGSITISGRNDLFGGMGGSAVWVHRLGSGVFSLGGTYEDAGSVDLNASDGSSRRVAARRDLLGLVGYSGALGSGMTSGYSVRLLHSELVEEFRATTAVFDGGVQIRASNSLNVGFALRDVGTQAKYLEDEVSPSPSVRGGAAFGCLLRDLLPFMQDSKDAVLLAADIDYRLVARQTFMLGGLEYRWRNLLSLRAGGSIGSPQRLGNLSLGLGCNIERGSDAVVKRYQFDYSIRLLTLGFDVPQMLSMTIVF